MSYRIGAALPVTNVVYVSCWDPQETLYFMRAFNELIPTVHDYIDQNLSAAAKESMICDVTAASGKGIIDQLIAEEGLEIPHIDRICGKANGRVKVYFADSSEKIICPLDYLRYRFLRRFGKRKPNKLNYDNTSLLNPAWRTSCLPLAVFVCICHREGRHFNIGKTCSLRTPYRA